MHSSPRHPTSTRGQLMRDHAALISEHTRSVERRTKFLAQSVPVQIALGCSILGLKLIDVQLFHLYAVVLLSILIILRIRNFTFIRTHDRDLSQRILEGVNLEKRYTHLGVFFHDQLKRFSLPGILGIMIKRALPDICILALFGIALYHLILETDPSFSLNLKPIYPFLAILGWLFSGLYFKPLEQLMHEQRKAEG